MVATVRDMSKTFDNGVPTPVLFDVDLSVAPGELLAIAGPSGSGKTTLLNIVGLLDTPTKGEVWIAGRDASRLGEDERAVLRRDYLGFVFQFHYLLPEFTALENALLPCRMRGAAAEAEAKERVAALLAGVGLADRLHYRPGQLSGGQQQRVALVRALANDPALVLADEPTGNLDSKSGHAVWDLMRALNRATGKAFVIVTHDADFARRADRVVHLVDGRVVDR
ncbi:MAG: ABC transporter ATP-binding protein [Candidatus Rokubacteria bacterium]|nr:ABC transporter ATP-binding protein [Candidatus Rokubacteria bacterium]